MIPQYLSVDYHIRGHHFEQMENPEFLRWDDWEDKHSAEWLKENTDKVMQYLYANETPETMQVFLDHAMAENQEEREEFSFEINALINRNLQGMYLEYVA